MTDVGTSAELGVRGSAGSPADLDAVNQRVLRLAQAQSADIAQRLEASGVTVLIGTARADDASTVVATLAGGEERTIVATPSSSPPARTHGSAPTPSPTASASSPGSRSTASPRCPST